MTIQRPATIAIGVLFLFIVSEPLAQTNVTGYIAGTVMSVEAMSVGGQGLRQPG